VIAVNPKLHPDVKSKKAALFIAWLTSPETQARIKSFQKHGQVLFWPTAVPEPAPKP
jgi:ABC-type tungstate transport system permease subunit